MDTTTIECLIHKALNRKRAHFLGVFPADKLPTLPRGGNYPLCFIANTDPASLPGTHWVAFYYKSPSDCDFFDSYGILPSDYGFSQQCKYGQRAIQSESSDVCGHHCIVYVVSRLSHSRLSLENYISRCISRFNGRKSDIDRFVKYRVVELANRLCVSCPAQCKPGALNQCCLSKCCKE